MIYRSNFFGEDFSEKAAFLSLIRLIYFHKSDKMILFKNKKGNHAMEILTDEEEERRIKQVLETKYLYMRDVNGKKIEFEIVSVVTMEKRIFIIVKNPSSKADRPKLAMFEYVDFHGQGRYNLVTDRALIRRVNEVYAERLAKMDEDGFIPPVPASDKK